MASGLTASHMPRQDWIPEPCALGYQGFPEKGRIHAFALSWSVSSIISDFSGGSVVKNIPAMQKLQEMWVQSLSQKDSLEEDMATHYRILAWRIPWTEDPDGLQSIGLRRVEYSWPIEHAHILNHAPLLPFSSWNIPNKPLPDLWSHHPS